MPPARLPAVCVFTAFCVLLTGLIPVFAWAECNAREPTRETSEGPHDYSMVSTDPEQWKEGDSGVPLFFRARVLDTCGKAVENATVQILHANEHGDHEHDRWRTTLKSGPKGEFKLLTVFPGYAGSIPRHIHFIISHPNHQQLVTRLFFKNDPAMDHGIKDLAMVLEEIQRGESKGWVAGYEFVIVPK